MTLSFCLFLSLFACKKQAAVVTAADEAALPSNPQGAKALPAHVEQMVENFERVHFEYDSSTLDDASKSMLAKNASIMSQHPSVQVEVQGHCDERGTTEYNIALGDRRARAVQETLLAEGVSPQRVAMVSYGEEMPLASGVDETSFSANRRAEFRVTWDDDGVVRGTVQ